jgi:hypothetical protein
MPRPISNPVPIPIPADLDPGKMPRVATAEYCAQVHTPHYGPISPRTIRERWGLPWKVVNGRSVTDVRGFLVEAARRFDAAPVVIGSAAEKQAA